MGTGENALPIINADGHVRKLEDIEADVIFNAITSCTGSLSAAARALRIGRTTIHRKLARYDDILRSNR